MDIFDKSKNKEKSNESLTSIQIGDWVTQYSAGFWKVVNIFPKYADEDYRYGDQSWKKGDRLGDWIVLKKGFTSKMKPSNACEFVDAQWCKPVANDIVHSIELAFSENPKSKAKFENAPSMPDPSVASTWMAFTDEQVQVFSEHLKNLPDRFTLEEFWSRFASDRKYIVDSSKATHILYLFSYLWEIDDKFEPLCFGPELRKL